MKLRSKLLNGMSTFVLPFWPLYLFWGFMLLAVSLQFYVGDVVLDRKVDENGYYFALRETKEVWTPTNVYTYNLQKAFAYAHATVVFGGIFVAAIWFALVHWVCGGDSSRLKRALRGEYDPS